MASISANYIGYGTLTDGYIVGMRKVETFYIVKIYDTFGVSDSMTKKISKHFQDAITLSENIVKSIKKRFVDTVGIKERFAVYLNGVYQRWSKIKQRIASYSDIVKPTTEYESISKKDTIWDRITKL